MPGKENLTTKISKEQCQILRIHNILCLGRYDKGPKNGQALFMCLACKTSYNKQITHEQWEIVSKKGRVNY
jgi:hypothetical protein